MALLDVANLSVRYGGVRALENVSLKVEEGALVGLIGPNGAGKTTFIDAITGFVRSTGTVTFDGAPLADSKGFERARAGLVRTFQSVELFDDQTVRENLLIAAETEMRGIRGLMAFRSGRNEIGDRVDRVLRATELDGFAQAKPPQLSQGQRKLVGVARALAVRPKLLLLDEPAAGLDSRESADFGRRIRRIVDAGVSALLIDHDMGLVFNVCDYVYVIAFGELLAEGPPADVRRNKEVIAAYLGTSASSAVEELLATGSDA